MVAWEFTLKQGGGILLFFYLSFIEIMCPEDILALGNYVNWYELVYIVMPLIHAGVSEGWQPSI